ncbi:hypothetical protein EM868_10075 [Cupriavidus gilardii]|nr:hypothetical protein [Cupriavidus gilardii]
MPAGTLPGAGPVVGMVEAAPAGAIVPAPAPAPAPAPTPTPVPPAPAAAPAPTLVSAPVPVAGDIGAWAKAVALIRPAASAASAVRVRTVRFRDISDLVSCYRTKPAAVATAGTRWRHDRTMVPLARFLMASGRCRFRLSTTPYKWPKDRQRVPTRRARAVLQNADPRSGRGSASIRR